MAEEKGPNHSLYKDPNVFDQKEMPLPNLLSLSDTLEEAFELWEGWKDRLFPLRIEAAEWDNGLIIKNSRYLYYNDPHHNEIERYFASIQESAFFYDRSTHWAPALWHSHILNLPNTPEDVILRQNWVKELVENEELFHAVESIFRELEVYKTDRASNHGEFDYHANLDPIAAKKILKQLSELASHNPNSEAIKSAIEWSDDVTSDSYFQHLVAEKRKINDPKILAFYSERYERRVWATLKEWVKLEHFCDVIPPSWESYEDTIWKGRRQKRITRYVLRADTSWDGHLDTIPFARVIQQINNINKLSSASLSVPLFLLLKQLKHLYLWALIYKDFEKRGLPVCFPEISNEEFDLSFEEFFPVWEVFKWKEKDELMPNSLSFTPQEKIVYIKWANSCGKSELFRSIHFANMLVNAGFPLPATAFKTWVVPSSKFILFQWNSQSGSQLESARSHVFRELKDVLPDSNLILDEVWDATNEPTAKEIWARFFPPLLEHGCRIFVTSHHDALDEVVRKLWWVALSPRQWAEWKKRYEIIRADWEIDYNAEATLDRLDITCKSVKSVLLRGKRSTSKRKNPEDRRRWGGFYDEEWIF